jgi:uncharacterized protein YbjT (DUF2867 family)
MIVITAPTGNIGHRLLDDLLERGQRVRTIARDPARLSSEAVEHVEVVPGSHGDVDITNEAFAGADSVFWLVPPDSTAESVMDHYLGFTRSACDAITSRRVKRVVGVSTLGHGITENAGQLSAALAADRLIQSTGVSYRALQMPFFMENLLHQVEAIQRQGAFFLANSADRTLLTVATRDVAASAAKLLLDDTWSGHGGVPVVGPDDLSPDGMAQVISEVLERPIRFQQITTQDYKATLMQYGMSDPWAQGLVDIVTAQEAGAYDDEPRAPIIPTTSFRQWCEEVLKPTVLA